MGRAEETPLVPSQHFCYQRTARDRVWTLVFFLFWLSCIAGGIYGIVHRNPSFTLDIKYLDNPKHCPYNRGRSLLSEQGPEDPQFDLPAFWHATSTWLLVSVAGSLLLGVAFLHIFKRHSLVMTKATIAAQVAAPLAAALCLLLAGQPIPGAVLLGVAGLSAVVFWMWRGEIGMAARLLGVSAHGLAANPHLITTTVLLNLISLVVALPLLVLLAFSFTNGTLVPNPDRQGAPECEAPSGEKVVCCTWQTDPWVGPFMAATSLLMLWTLLLANQIRVFVVSGTVAQWYFAPPSSLGSSTKGSTRRSLQYALGPSLGSLCLSSAVLTVTETLRQAAQNAQDENSNAGLVQVCFYFCAQMLLSLVEYLTKFATVMMAITGEAFMAAGRRVTTLLARNFLNAFASTVWFTPMVIRLACISLSLGWGLLSAGGYYLLRPAGLEANHGVNSAVLGGVVGAATLFVLSFLGGVLLSVLDATFVCWAIDRDTNTVSHPEVYEVFMSVPLKTPQGTVVEQPGGGLAYGAEEGGERAPLVTPPTQQAGPYQPPTIHRAP